MTETFVALGLMFGAIFVIIGIAIYFGKKKGKIIQAQFLSLKVTYEKALSDLEMDPSSSEKHQLALTKGREYYSILHPSTHDVDGRGVASNFKDNSGIAELKVQSDIQARTKKGNVS